jgi:hypothetical protein
MTLKTLRLMAAYLLLALTLTLTGYGLMGWVDVDAAKVDDYQIMIRLTEPVEVGR